MADAPKLRLIGWGPFRLPGEARRWAEAEERARNAHVLASAPASRPVEPAAAAEAAPAADPAAAAPASPQGPAPRPVMQPLTAQERTMVELLADGHNVSAISKRMEIPTREVTTTLVTINRKTGRFDQAGFADLVAHLRGLGPQPDDGG